MLKKILKISTKMIPVTLKFCTVNKLFCGVHLAIFYKILKCFRPRSDGAEVQSWNISTIKKFKRQLISKLNFNGKVKLSTSIAIKIHADNE